MKIIKHIFKIIALALLITSVQQGSVQAMDRNNNVNLNTEFNKGKELGKKIACPCCTAIIVALTMSPILYYAGFTGKNLLSLAILGGSFALQAAFYTCLCHTCSRLTDKVNQVLQPN